MTSRKAQSNLLIRDLVSYDDLSQIPALEKDVWGLADNDVLPMTFIIASHAAGSLWQGAFDGGRLVGFAFGILARQDHRPSVHSHMLAVRQQYRDQNVG